MSEQRDYTGCIIVGTDGSPSAEAAIRWAARRAQVHGRRLVVLSSSPQVPPLSRGEIYTELSEGRDPALQLARLKERTQERLAAGLDLVRAEFPGLDVEGVLDEGEASYPLARATKTADLVVLGARGQSAGLRTRALGGTSDATITHAHGPVVIVPEGADWDAAGPVVVGVDDSEATMEAIRLAVVEAVALGVPLRAVHAWDPMPWFADLVGGWTVDEKAVGAGLDRMVRDLVGAYADVHPDLVVERIVRPGHPANALIELSRTASLVAVGSRGRGGFAGLLLGSTSREVIREAHCPVLVTRPRRSTP